MPYLVFPVDPFSLHIEKEVKDTNLFVRHGFFDERSQLILEYLFGVVVEAGSKSPDSRINEDALEFVRIWQILDVE